VLSRSSSDLRAPVNSLRLSLRPPARLATPVLVVAALLFGVGVGAAVFATLWQQQASHRQAAEQALASSRAQTRLLGGQIVQLHRVLTRSQRDALAASRAVARGKTIVADLAYNAQPLLASAGSLQQQATSLTQRARSLDGLIGSLDNDLASLNSYVTGATNTNLDPAFLKAQLAYLKPNLTKVGRTTDGLASEVNAYSRTVRAFVTSLSAYANTIRPTQH
jgi:hypothetical protein